jgi:hypothetical protein
MECVENLHILYSDSTYQISDGENVWTIMDDQGNKIELWEPVD